jgi:hypothetical protein
LKRCYEYVTKDRWVNDQVESYIDQKSNRDGRSEPEETKKSADECR